MCTQISASVLGLDHREGTWTMNNSYFALFCETYLQHDLAERVMRLTGTLRLFDGKYSWPQMSFAAVAAAADDDVMTSKQQSQLITAVYITVQIPRSAHYYVLHLDRTRHNAMFDQAFF